MAIDSHLLQPGTGRALKLESGKILRVCTLEDAQVVDVICCCEQGLDWISSGRSIDYNQTIRFTRGNVIYSNRSRPMLTITVDDTGKHDFLFAACSQSMFEKSYGVTEPHPNCTGILRSSLARVGFQVDDLPTPFNAFMTVEVDLNGKTTVLPPASKPGDSIEFQAEMDLWIAVSACPAPACNGFSGGPIRIEWE